MMMRHRRFTALALKPIALAGLVAPTWAWEPRAVDGVDFRVADGSHLTFYLEVDGVRAPPNQSYLSARGMHPAHNPFTIRR